jgi:hypothetical protein
VIKLRITTMSLQSTLEIERLNTQNKWLFAGYMALLALTALAGWLVWRSGNRVQDAIRSLSEANVATARAAAEEAKKDAAEAYERAGIANQSAAKANERAERLETENLTLRGQVATLEAHAAGARKDVATLQKAAADAKAAQQRVETDLADARRKQADAELKLEDIRKSQMPRIFSFNFARFSEALRGKPSGHAILIYQRDDGESYEFASKLFQVLTAAGWTATVPKPTEPSNLLPSALVAGGGLPTIWPRSSGVEIVAKDIAEPLGSTKTLCGVLMEAFFAAGFGGAAAPDGSLPDNVVRLVIGQRQ